MKIKLGFSTCPNDTFMFDALVNGKIDTLGYEFDVVMEDILHLNQKAINQSLDMVKISYFTYGKILDTYKLLSAGSALGHACGPLLIAKEGVTMEDILSSSLPVAIPGKNTTANFLLHFYSDQIAGHTQEMTFEKVMPAVIQGDCIAGLIIHENRFTYQKLGLKCIQDLGEYWENETQNPIPLGAIVAQKRLGRKVINDLNQLMIQSVKYAFEHPEASREFISKHAQELEPAVTKAHIQLYVNEYSVDLGPKGTEAITRLLSEGVKAEMFPLNSVKVFREENHI